MDNHFPSTFRQNASKTKTNIGQAFVRFGQNNSAMVIKVKSRSLILFSIETNFQGSARTKLGAFLYLVINYFRGATPSRTAVKSLTLFFLAKRAQLTAIFSLVFLYLWLNCHWMRCDITVYVSCWMNGHGFFFSITLWLSK